ncbi:unnamed protein product, partial [Ectocarpus sp. 8 AP-2014]
MVWYGRSAAVWRSRDIRARCLTRSGGSETWSGKVNRREEPKRNTKFGSVAQETRRNAPE